MTFLATTFSDLANDPGWPGKYIQDAFKQAYVKSQLCCARLALMVVDAQAKHRGVCAGLDLSNKGNLRACVQSELEQNNITPSHYANVKKRVEEASDTKG